MHAPINTGFGGRSLPLIVMIGAIATVALSCAGILSPGASDSGCDFSAARATADSNPILERPFAGVRPVTNYFDHEFPAPEDRRNGFQLTFCDTRFRGPVDGHTGFDWLMSEGTPVLAAVSGVVEFAGREPSFSCGALGVVSGLVVQLRHSANNVRHVLVYAHVSDIMVSAGDTVTAGDVVALSGNTGCSTEPHLHFEVYRSDGGPLIATDPYGWSSPEPDPWATHPRGGPSVWLWKANHAP